MKENEKFYQNMIVNDLIDYIEFLNKKSYDLLFLTDEIKSYNNIVNQLYNKKKIREDNDEIYLTRSNVYNSIKELNFLVAIIIEILLDFNDETRDMVNETFKQNLKSNKEKVKTKIK